jgi:hypothetical protein
MSDVIRKVTSRRFGTRKAKKRNSGNLPWFRARPDSFVRERNRARFPGFLNIWHCALAFRLHSSIGWYILMEENRHLDIQHNRAAQ